MNTKAQKIARLKNKKYRDAFVASQISVGLPFQIRALREQRGWKQSRLASETGMLQPRISAMESPGGAKFNLETLRRLASAFDVALAVRFVPFSELVDWTDRFTPDTFEVPSFKEDFSKDEKAPKKTAAQAIGGTEWSALTKSLNSQSGLKLGHQILDSSYGAVAVGAVKGNFLENQPGFGSVIVTSFGQLPRQQVQQPSLAAMRQI